MSTTEEEPVVIEVPVGSALEAQTRGEIDIQIATARKWPRSIRTFIDTALEMATLDEETAEACFYALPRDGKTIEGPSARLAEIVGSAWGHMRAGGRVVDEDDRFITGRGFAWDIQTNFAIEYEVKRRITNKGGRKFNDDMVGVTGNAATSIALRNAIFKVVPSAYWRPIYHACRRVAVGDASTLVDRRAKMLAYFQKMGVPETRVLGMLGVKGVEDITLDQLATLKGLATAIKEGDTTVDEAFPIDGTVGKAAVQQPQRASEAEKKAGNGNGNVDGGTASVPSQAVKSSPAGSTPAPSHQIVAGQPYYIKAVTQPAGKKHYFVETREGLTAHSFHSGKTKTDLEAARDLGVPIILTGAMVDFSPAPFQISSVALQREPGSDD